MITLFAAALIGATPAISTDTISLKADAGFVNTSGNTELTTVNLGTALGLTTSGWGVKQKFGVIYGTTEGETSTSLWTASLRGDRSIANRLQVYLLSEFDRNTFAGVRSRFAQSAGLAWSLIDTERDKLSTEMGAGYVWQKAVAPSPDESFMSGRIALAYLRSLGEKAEFGQLVEVLPNLESGNDLRVNSLTSLTAPLGNGVSMKASYLIRHDGQPEPGFEKTDRILTTGIQVTF